MSKKKHESKKDRKKRAHKNMVNNANKYYTPKKENVPYTFEDAVRMGILK